VAEQARHVFGRFGLHHLRRHTIFAHHLQSELRNCNDGIRISIVRIQWWWTHMRWRWERIIQVEGNCKVNVLTTIVGAITTIVIFADAAVGAMVLNNRVFERAGAVAAVGFVTATVVVAAAIAAAVVAAIGAGSLPVAIAGIALVIRGILIANGIGTGNAFTSANPWRPSHGFAPARHRKV
jgi:hypothetical protein